MKRNIPILVLMMLAVTGCGEQENPGAASRPKADTIPVSIITETMTDSPMETTTAPTEAETAAETTEAEEKYYQSYPVQDYQKAYAELLDSQEREHTAYVIHIDEDVIPELVVTQSLDSAMMYSFDGTEIYEVGMIGLDYYMYDFRYRPYLGMVSHSGGSVMYGNRQTVVQIFEKIDGRLQQVDGVFIAHSESALNILLSDAEMMGVDAEYLYGFEDTIPYDIGGKEESWISPDEYMVTDAQIAYWLAN